MPNNIYYLQLLLTYRIQLELSQISLEFGVILPNGYVCFEPFRQSEPMIVSTIMKHAYAECSILHYTSVLSFV